MTRETAQAPTRAKNSSGDFAPIETSLVETGDRLAPGNTTRTTTLSADGDGYLATLTAAKGAVVSMSTAEDLQAPSVEGAVATYPVEGNANESVSVGALDNGFEARVVLDQAPQGSAEAPAADPTDGSTGATPQTAAPPTYTFDFTLDGLTADLVDNRLELRDSKGKLVAASRSLRMWDSTVDAAGDPTNVVPVDAQLTKTASGARLVLTPSVAFLTDPKTKYPVTIDPDVTVPVNGDTWYYSGQTSADNKSADSRIAIGSPDGTQRRRGLIYFYYQSFVGQTVTSASVRLRQYFAPTCTAKQMNLYPTTEDVPSPIWGNQPSVSGSMLWKTVKSFNHGASGCAAGFESIDVTPIVNGWAGLHVNGDTLGNDRQGLMMRADDEYDTSQEKRFCSHQPTSVVGDPCNTTANIPVLSVTYRPDLGTQSWYSMTDHQLNQASSLSVNNKTGNLVVGARDVNVNGVGIDLNVSRYYNAQSPDTSSLGKGWNLSVGPDVWLEKMSTYRYDYHSPTGAVLGSFVRKSTDTDSADYNQFVTPVGGVGADLEQTGSTFTLKFHKSQTKYTFTDNSPDDHAYLTKLQDRSDNAITLAYSGTTSANKPKLSTITDSSGRTYTITYSGDYITKIANTATGPGLREWQYGYTGGYLTSYTDPMANTTNYAYEDVTSGPDLLDTITDPQNQSGRRPTASITYGYDSGLDINQVTKASYRYGTGETELYDYTWDYSTTIPSACESHGSFSTVVTDPNAHDTTYCYKKRTDDGQGSTSAVAMKTWVYDALGHAKSVEYSPDNGPTNVTDPSGQLTNNSTAAKYSGAPLQDRIEKVTAPKSDATNEATTGFEYGAGSGVAGGNYLPTKVKDPNGNCNRFGYDSKGRTTDAFTGITATSDSAGTCADTGGNQSHRDYDNATGNVLKSWDANSGSTPPTEPADADSTIYTYWATTDTGYVAGTKDQLKSVRKPGGDCSATVAAGRKLCTSYTYDGAGRVTSVTNGNAKITTYTYDKMDRTTGAFFNGATSCDLFSSNCVTYAYDAEGNLVTRVEGSSQTSTFNYDQLNRQVAQYNQNGLLQSTDQIGLAYDGVGNLTIYAQIVESVYDPVYYYYDAANRLNGVGDATAVSGVGIGLTTDADGRTQSITFPKPSGTNGMKVDYDYTKTGKPKSLDIKTHTGTSLAAFDYDYVKSLYGNTFEVETSQMQNRTVTGGLSNLNSNVQYSYNTDGQLIGADATAGTDYTYEYDNVGNVTKEQAATTTYYGYDRAGELCWKGTNTGTKLDRACPPTPSGNTTINHDQAGNITNTGADPIAYNDRDQVSAIGGVTMTYRDLGNDLRRTSGSTRTVRGPMGITATVTGSAVTFYTRDPQGTILNSHDTSGTRNYVTEYNGSVAALYNPSGTAVGSYKYTPYGATTVAAESGGTIAPANPFRYIGGYQDKTSGSADGYYKLGARYYDTHGHFTQADPIKPGGGGYSYTSGDPINSQDPSGMVTLNFGVTACAGLCVGLDLSYDFDSGTGATTLSGGYGAGVSTRLGQGFSGSTGKLSTGSHKPAVSCDVGPFGISTSGGEISPSFNYTRSLSASCNHMAGYTWAYGG